MVVVVVGAGAVVVGAFGAVVLGTAAGPGAKGGCRGAEDGHGHLVEGLGATSFGRRGGRVVDLFEALGHQPGVVGAQPVGPFGLEALVAGGEGGTGQGHAQQEGRERGNHQQGAPPKETPARPCPAPRCGVLRSRHGLRPEASCTRIFSFRPRHFPALGLIMSTPALRQHERPKFGRVTGSGGEPHASKSARPWGAAQLAPKAPSALPAQSEGALCWSRFGGQNTNEVQKGGEQP